MSGLLTTNTVDPILIMSPTFSGCRLLCSPSDERRSQVRLVEPTSVNLKIFYEASYVIFA
jgi:hypothetical protein